MSFDQMTPNSTQESPDSSKIGTYAIVETSGTQFWLEENRYYDLDRIDGKVDDKITLEKVLLINDSKGLSIGKPYIKDALVELKIMAHKRGKKIIVYKMRPKKKTRRKNGHRQELTRVVVTSISNGDKTKRSSKTEQPMKGTEDKKALKAIKAGKAVKDVKKAVKEVKAAVKEVKTVSASKAKTSKNTLEKKNSKIKKTTD